MAINAATPPSETIFLFEFTCGGGLTRDMQSSSLFCEGFAMLHALASELQAAGTYSLLVLLDGQFREYQNWFPGCKLVFLERGEAFQEKFLECVDATDASYLVAPEFDNILWDLANAVETRGKRLLSSSSSLIEVAGHKSKMHQVFEEHGLLVPKTLELTTPVTRTEQNRVNQFIAKVGFPAVLKPEDGAGSEGMWLIQDSPVLTQISQVLAGTGTTGKPWLLQEYIRGTPMSVSLFCRGGRVIHDFFNNQQVQLKTDPQGTSHYHGGVSPVEFAFPVEVKARLAQIVEELQVTGYIGVDFLLSGQDVYFLEVNPRLTTSFVGLRRVLEGNLAASLLGEEPRAAKEQVSPPSRKRCRVCLFERASLSRRVCTYLRALPDPRVQFPELLSPVALFPNESHTDILYHVTARDEENLASARAAFWSKLQNLHGRDREVDIEH